MHYLRFLPIFFLLSCSTTPVEKVDYEQDFLWMEEVEGPRALNWVQTENQRTLKLLKGDPRFNRFEAEDLTNLEDQDRIPAIQRRGDWVYNFWRDQRHVRGILRRMSFGDFQAGKKTWTTLLDVDALAQKEKENWVYKGKSCLPPQETLCMLRLSKGGKDASVFREYDLEKGSFVKDGFTLPETKGAVVWLDHHTLLAAAGFEASELTQSGYPHSVRLWTRGTPFKKASVLINGAQNLVGVWPAVLRHGSMVLPIVEEALTFYSGRVHVYNQGKLNQLKLPLDIQTEGVFNGELVFRLRSVWKSIPQGSLVSVALEKLLQGQDVPVNVLFKPTPEKVLASVAITQSHVYLVLMNKVKGEALRLEGGGSRRIELPENGTASVHDSHFSHDHVFFNYEGFLSPDRLYYLAPGAKTGKVTLLRSLKAKFKDKNLVVDQFQARSKDGTLVPYFVVSRKNLSRDGKNPALLYGYGGFENAMTPYYSPTVGKLWLERGGTYVLANIRGGGEFGPAWHQAALRENRQKAFDDFIAVAEDLIDKKITQPSRLGIMGGSNGGLLVGAVTVQRPELFGAVVCQVPLLDMLRYHRLLAGASWMEEYGNPESSDRDFLGRFSPYQNLKKDHKYPPIFFVTTTKDDRVHPAHARRMAAKMQSMGHPFYYYENIEGGHSAGSNLKQHATRHALEYVFLHKKLTDKK